MSAEIQAFFLGVWALTGVKVITSHIAFNVILAVAAAARTGEFTFAKLAEFLYRKVAPFVLAYYAAVIFGESAGFTWLAPAVWTIVTANLAANTLDSLNVLGVPLPEAVLRLVSSKPDTRLDARPDASQ